MERKTVGFLGCGKIGKTLVKHVMKRGDHTVGFIHGPHFVNDCDLAGSNRDAWKALLCKRQTYDTYRA